MQEPVYKDGMPAWLCQCVCGVCTVVKNADLRNTKSCGCLRVDMGRARQTHGLSKSRTYQAWRKMKTRCLNPKDKAWPNYGGRGITVCERWQNSFQMFLQDMGECPEGLSLDRIDNSQGYTADNCRWTTAAVQANNKRSTTRFTYKGQLTTLTQLSAQSGKSIQTIAWRIHKMGMTPEHAVETPSLRQRKQGRKDGSDDAAKAFHYLQKLNEVLDT